jgi:uncharacterized membrane protein YeaQ/YmgE (transglycosylase-associated protein family)
MSFIGWLILGTVVGGFAKSVMKQDKGGWGSTLAVGIGGSIVGGWISGLVLGISPKSFFNPFTWLVAFGGACLCILVYTLINKKSASA